MMYIWTYIDNDDDDDDDDGDDDDGYDYGDSNVVWL